MNYSVYRHISPSNKIYIGITGESVNLRWAKGYRKNTIFGRALGKYGFDSFKHEVLFSNLTKEKAELFEIKLIYFYKHILGISYNDANGGCSRGKLSEESKRKIGLAHIGNKNCLGKKHSLETRKKISLRLTGKTTPFIVRKKISNSLKGISNPNKKETIQLDSITKEIINIFKSSCEAALITNINRTNISACCHKRIPTAGGYIWRYKN
jgi:group I intron endonuclease